MAVAAAAGWLQAWAARRRACEGRGGGAGAGREGGTGVGGREGPWAAGVVAAPLLREGMLVVEEGGGGIASVAAGPLGEPRR